MKKFYLITLSVLFAGALQAQLFTDNFDAYNVGDYLGVVGGANWTTWSGATGGAEDVQITNAQSSSPSNAIYFASTGSQGGPQDVVLDFGQQYTSGIFTFEADFYIEAGKGGYWNFQATPVIGTTWAANCYMENASIDIDGLVNANFPEAQWNNVRVVANLTLQQWSLYVNNTLAGTWSNPINQLASLDIYPLQGNGFYVDNVSFDHQPYTLQNINLGVSNVDMVGAVATMDVHPRVRLLNAGLNPITSFDVTLDYNGTTLTENVTGVNIASLGDYEVEFATSMTLIGGANDAMAYVSNVNGANGDDDVNDDTLVNNVNPIVAAPGKVVVGEEATGTWCQWCPRGAVYMDLWEERYGKFFAGVAVHNSDPMEDADYDAGMQGLISGYPSAVVDRLSDVDPSAMSPDINSRLQVPPVATVLNGANWNATTRVLDVSLTYTFNQAIGNDYRVACVITEDSVTGTGGGYAQSNAYSGGTSGPMGGYENLPAIVPASQMVYEHVARGIAPSFTGMQNPFPPNMMSGMSHTLNFSFTLSTDWDESKMHIVGMLLDANGRVDNAGYTTVDEAVLNGFIVGVEQEGSAYLEGPDRTLSVYPNPSRDFAYASLNLTAAAEVQLAVYDITGRAVLSRDYGTLDGGQILPLNLSQFAPGLYTVTALVNGKAFSKKLRVE